MERDSNGSVLSTAKHSVILSSKGLKSPKHQPKLSPKKSAKKSALNSEECRETKESGAQTQTDDTAFEDVEDESIVPEEPQTALLDFRVSEKGENDIIDTNETKLEENALPAEDSIMGPSVQPSTMQANSNPLPQVQMTQNMRT